MKINQMYINNKYERIDNNEVKKDAEGYFILVWNGKLFSNDYNKYYLNTEEENEYIKIMNHNKNDDIIELKIQDAIKNNRVKEVPQYINKQNKPVAIMYIYYDEQGNEIKKQHFNKDNIKVSSL